MDIVAYIEEFLELAENVLVRSIATPNIEFILIDKYNNIHMNVINLYIDEGEDPDFLEYLLRRLRSTLFKCINKLILLNQSYWS